MVDHKASIGKDVIESLTLGMYEDSRFIYREYIQNSADQIDEALETGLISSMEQAKIEIEIDKNGREVTISDNATGIPQESVLSILKNVAQSTKDRSKHKGFRGIGRLGGLGYCDTLVFETSAKGESVKSRLVWDAQKLKNIIHNREKKEEASHVIDLVTSYSTDRENSDTVYFKVHLIGVTSNDLLDKENILSYLQMVAPVPFNKGFVFKTPIHDKLESLDCVLDEYPIYVNNNRVFKAYTTTIYQGEEGNKSKIDEINDVEFFVLDSPKRGRLGIGWFGISNFEKQIPKINTARGLRIRKSNIQIGADNTLAKLFKEDRGTYYFFGEVHAIHPDLIPNSRRDYFLENDVLTEFEKLLRIKLQGDLHNLYYFASKVRSEKRKIEQLAELSNTIRDKEKKGWSSQEEQSKYVEKFELQKEKAEQAEAELDKIKSKIDEQETAKRKLFDRVAEGTKGLVDGASGVQPEARQIKYATDELSKLNKKDRKLVSSIFGIIDNVLPRELAENLKEKIKEEFR